MGESDVLRHAADESFSAAGTATENTPLLRSETASTVTAGDGPQAEGQALDASQPSEPELGFKQALCLIFSMWALIFLQGKQAKSFYSFRCYLSIFFVPLRMRYRAREARADHVAPQRAT